MEDFKGITQETADDMLNALQEFNEASESFRATFEARMEVYMTECQRASAMKVCVWYVSYTLVLVAKGSQVQRCSEGDYTVERGVF